MKNILGHTSWNWDEIIEMLKKSKGFTMCNLPHYRYQRVKTICFELSSYGMIKKVKRTDLNIHWATTELFNEWIDSPYKGRNGAKKFHKLKNPPKPLKIRTCLGCQKEYQPTTPQQKFCTNHCRPQWKFQQNLKAI